MATQNIVINVAINGAQNVALQFGNIAKGAKEAHSSVQTLKTLFAGLAVGATTAALTHFADSFTLLKNKTAVFARTSSEASDGLKGVYDIAIATRQPVDAVGETFQRMSLALSGTGKSTGQLLQVTENITKAIAISGATAQEAQGALRQLSQAFSYGSLRGQEYNSVAKEAPVITKLIAKELGVETSALKALANQGKITADVMFRALNSTAYINELFGKVTITFEQSFTQMKTAVGELIGRLNEMTGIGTTVSGWISKLAIYIHNLANDKDRLKAFWENFKAGALAVAFLALPAVIQGITGMITAMARLPAVLAAVQAFAGPWGLLALAIGGAVVALYRFRDVPFQAYGKELTISAVVIEGWKEWSDWITKVADGLYDAVDAFDKWTKAHQVADLPKAASTFGDKAVGFVERNFISDEARQNAAAELAAKPKTATPEAAPGFIDRASDRLKKDRAAQKVADELAAAKEKADREESERLRKKEADELAAKTAAEELSRAQLQALKAFQQLNQQFDAGADVGLQYAEGLQIVATFIQKFPNRQAEAQKAVEGLTNKMVLQQETLDKTPPYLRELESAYNAVLAEVDPLAAGQKELELQFAKIQAAASRFGKTTDEVALLQGHLAKVQKEQADGMKASILSAWDPTLAVMNDYEKKIREIDELVATKQLSPEEGKAAKAFTKKQSDLQKAANDIGANTGELNPGEQLAKGFNASLAQMQLDLGTFAQQSKDLFGDIFKSTTDSLSSWATGNKAAFKDLEKTVVSAVATMVIKLLALYAVQKLTGAIGGGAGGIGGAIVSGLVGGRAGGGDVVAGQSYWVGEDGPEKFHAGKSGTIERSDKRERAPAPTVNIYVTTPDADSFQKSQGQILANAHRTLGRANGRNN